MLQGLEHAGINLYPFLQPVIKTYYQGLTLHGVLNALVWTTFFTCGFLAYATLQVFDRPLRYPSMHWIALAVMVIGLLMSAVAMLTNKATVLYTFYAPMMAVWFHCLTGARFNPVFKERTGSTNPLVFADTGSLSAPTFVDIDGDKDYDAFVGNDIGTVRYFRNDSPVKKFPWIMFMPAITGQGK